MLSPSLANRRSSPPCSPPLQPAMSGCRAGEPAPHRIEQAVPGAHSTTHGKFRGRVTDRLGSTPARAHTALKWRGLVPAPVQVCVRARQACVIAIARRGAQGKRGAASTICGARNRGATARGQVQQCADTHSKGNKGGGCTRPPMVQNKTPRKIGQGSRAARLSFPVAGAPRERPASAAWRRAAARQSLLERCPGAQAPGRCSCDLRALHAACS